MIYGPNVGLVIILISKEGRRHFRNRSVVPRTKYIHGFEPIRNGIAFDRPDTSMWEIDLNRMTRTFEDTFSVRPGWASSLKRYPAPPSPTNFAMVARCYITNRR